MYILFLKKKYKHYADFHLSSFPLIYFPSILLRINYVYQLHAYHTSVTRILKMKALQEHKVSSVPTYTTGIQQKPIQT